MTGPQNREDAMRRAVVFDIGNVLLRWDPEKLYAPLIPDAAERRRFLSEICPPAWNLAFDAGAPMPEGVEAHAARHPAHADLIRAWWHRWPEMTGPLIEGSVACLHALKARGVPVFGLTNFAAETFEVARRLYPVLDAFDTCVVSAAVRCVKPDPAIYRILEARTGFAPDRLLFTDDSAANVAGARACGWAAHHFEGPAGLVAALEAEGFLEPGAVRL
jgi:2-haloacid dehalogenase